MFQQELRVDILSGLLIEKPLMNITVLGFWVLVDFKSYTKPSVHFLLIFQSVSTSWSCFLWICKVKKNLLVLIIFIYLAHQISNVWSSRGESTRPGDTLWALRCWKRPMLSGVKGSRNLSTIWLVSVIF